MIKEQIAKVLEQHLQWVESAGNAGERATFTGANLTGANLTGATYRGEPVTKAPISLSGFAYPVTILDTHAQIGCQFKSFAEWLTCDRRDFAPFKAAFEAVLRAAGRWPLAADDESA